MSIQCVIVISSAITAAITGIALWFTGRYQSKRLERIEKDIKNKSDKNKQEKHVIQQMPNYWNGES